MLVAIQKRFFWLLLPASLLSCFAAQIPSAPGSPIKAIARLAPNPHDSTHKPAKAPPAVIWLNPVETRLNQPFLPGSFTLLQKNKMFTPHLLVLPVGSTVSFPNADPFFHNVFSLFDGKRFDLGLYEAGSTRSVVFSRVGVSYIFCNIHSEMSAVVIALETPYFAIDDAHGVFLLDNMPPGDYDLHVWIEGQKQASLDTLTRRVRVRGEVTDLGEIRGGQPEPKTHVNKFGRPYNPDPRPIY
jgi:hypothetical protein